MLWDWPTELAAQDRDIAMCPRILVVDDDAIDRRHTARILTEIFGAELSLEFATSWDEAMAAVVANAHDIYIIDHFLGLGTGLEIVDSAGPSADGRIFILLTGKENRKVDVAATRAGVADFIVKKDLNAMRLERSLRYAYASMAQKQKLVEQAGELRRAKAEIEADAQKQRLLARDLKRTQDQLTEALMRAERSERRYRWLAQHDLLTKIPNRALFAEKLREGLRQASRSGRKLALLLLDINRFKWINDSFGHQIGDEFLVEVVERLTMTLRETDIVARVGGDEFAVIATNLDDENAASVVAEKIVFALSKPYTISGNHIESGASVGIAMLEERGSKDAEVMIQEADSALYRAKLSERSAFHFYDDALDEEVQRTLLLKRELPLAREYGELSLVFQPKVRLTNGAVSGVEALTRWNHRTLGAVSPAEFIPISESTGQIIPLSAWVLEEALKTAASWQGTICRDVPIALNLSALQLKQVSLVSDVQQLLERYAVDPANLELEITETAALDNLELAIKQLNQLRALGIKISIDDFGTGYSSLALATRLPADCLKIDISFVANMLNDQAATAAVDSTVALARSLGIRTVAEGIETEEQATYLRRRGCDEGQGYLFAKPLTGDRLTGWVEAQAERLQATS